MHFGSSDENDDAGDGESDADDDDDDDAGDDADAKHQELHTWQRTIVPRKGHFLMQTGAVVAHTRYNWGASGWKAAVTDRKVWDKRIVDGSECCQVCRENFPETKTWQKFKNYNRCSCLSFDDHFDPSKYERSHGSYSIGSCEEAQIFRPSNMG